MSDTPKKPKVSGQKTASAASHAGPKVFDVMRPGRALATATSRPIITGHKPKVKDSVVVADRSPQSDAQKASKKKADQIVQAAEPETLMDANKKVTLQSVQHTASPAEGSAQQPTLPPAASDIPTVVIDAVDGTPSIQRGAAEATQQPQSVPAQHTTTPETQTHARGDAPAPPTMNYAAPSSSAATQKADDVLATTAAPIVDMSKAVISQHLGKPRHSRWLPVILMLIVLLAAISLLFIYL